MRVGGATRELVVRATPKLVARWPFISVSCANFFPRHRLTSRQRAVCFSAANVHGSKEVAPFRPVFILPSRTDAHARRQKADHASTRIRTNRHESIAKHR